MVTRMASSVRRVLAGAALVLVAACAPVPVPRRSVYHPSDADLSVTRIVHGSVIIEMHGTRVLVDPWFHSGWVTRQDEPLGLVPEGLPSFAAVLISWIVLNAALLLNRGFDPYPFILLNLILSCLAAIQAPIIMMSQNRAEARDRLRSENDYKVNLKAELEIRHLHEKIDHLLRKQYNRLFEIQQIQIELLEEISQKRKG